MKTALVLEGGAMRGMYTAGVLDSFLEAGLSFDGIIGVSAGALFGVNYLSEQKGRAIRYCCRYNQDKEYMGIRSLMKTGNVMNEEYVFHRVPEKLDPFDDEKYMESTVPFYAVATSMETGKAEYMPVRSVLEEMEILRASGAMPFLSRPVEIGGRKYLDGAMADSIPFEYMLSHGYDRAVVVLTKPRGYVKEPMKNWMVNLKYRRKWPLFAGTLKNRHVMYNGQLERLNTLEEKGTCLCLYPSEYPPVEKMETDPEKMKALYNVGVSDGRKAAEKLKKEWF